jgi:hypothetical protein
VAGQQANSLKVKENMRFLKYLSNSGQNTDAIYLLNQIDFGSPAYRPYMDSLNFLKGWSFYSEKLLDSASYYFLKTSPSVAVGIKSRFFAAYNHIYQRNYQNGIALLSEINVPDSQLLELRHIQLAGVALLHRNYTEYLAQQRYCTGTWYPVAEAEGKLNEHYVLLSEHNYKSVLVAGAMSFVIPGSGKIYAGKVGEGVSALLSNAILAFITVENYRKLGPRNFKTIFFGSLFAIFYVGNVYGSMISVQFSNSEFDKFYDNKILLDIHIPLRTIFN